MAKAITAYVCTDCGAEHGQWQGQCSACEAWNTLSKIILASTKGSTATTKDFRVQTNVGQPSSVENLSDVDLKSSPRFSTEITEFDRVLGGGRLNDGGSRSA